jgi:outer membrane biogenesis lipoprotein LolB
MLKVRITLAASVLALLSLTGCASKTPAPPQKNTSDAVSDVMVVSVHQCLKTTDQNSPEFKVCLSQQLDAAAEQIRRYQKCVSPVGCKPDTGR